MRPLFNNNSVTAFEWQLQRSFFAYQTEPILSPSFSLVNDKPTQLALSLFVRNPTGYGVKMSVGFVLKAKNQPQKMLRIKLQLKSTNVIGQEIYSKVIVEKDFLFGAIGNKWQTDFLPEDYSIIFETPAALRDNFNAILCCEVTDLNPIKFDTEVDSNSTFRKQLWDLWLNDIGTDLTIKVVGEEIKAHKMILISQSEVLKTMLTNPQYNEAQENSIKIKDFDSDTIKAFVEWLYLGKVEEFASYVEKLFAVADFYGVEKLVDQCAEELAKSLTNENLAQRFIAAILHSHDPLKQYIIDFISQKPTIEVVRFFMSPEWISFVQSYGHLASEMMKNFEDRLE